MDLSQAINELQSDLQPRILGAKEIETIERHAQQIREGVNFTSNDPAEQRKIYQTLQMESTLNYEPAERVSEKGQHWADFYCILRQDRLSTAFL